MDKVLGLTIARCAVACRGDIPKSTLSRVPKDALTFMLGIISNLVTPEEHIAPNARPSEFAGYIVLDIGPLSAHVPFHLIDLFPVDAHLEHLINLAKLIKLDPRSPICISGSATFMDAAKAFSDIDFCEYSFETNDNISKSATKKISDQPADLACVLVSAGGVEFKFPSPSDFKRMKRAGSRPDASWMIHYVGDVPSIGIIPISNLTLMVRSDDPEGIAYHKSWAFQEVMIAAPGIAPRPLDHPTHIGNYVLWLMGEVEKYQKKRPIKALKRALSLARILQLENESKPILELLATASVKTAAAVEAIREVELTLSGVVDARKRSRLEIAVARAKASLPNELARLTERQLNSHCLMCIKQLTSSVSRTLERAKHLGVPNGKASVRRR